MRLRLDLSAQEEIRHAALFYEDCRNGFGQEFLHAIGAAFEHIQRHPTVWRILKGRFRR